MIAKILPYLAVGFFILFILRFFIIFIPYYLSPEWKKRKKRPMGKKLPEQFGSYLSLEEETLGFGQYTIKLLFESKFPIKTYHTQYNHLILTLTEETSDLKTKYTYLKLDKDANIIDSTEFLRSELIENQLTDESMHEGYILNKREKYFRSWALDGDVTRKPFIVINEDLSMEKEILEKSAKQLINESKYLDTHYISGSPLVDRWTRIVQKFCFYNQQWYLIYGKSDADLGDIITKGNKNNDVFSHFNKSEQCFYKKEVSQLSLDYFHILEKYKASSSIGGGSQIVTKTYLTGNPYLSLNLEGSTLKFKGKRDTFVSDNRFEQQLRKPYQYHTHPQLNFELFSTSDSNLYLIRKNN